VKIEDILGQAGDIMAVRRVFGEPYEKDGITFVPVARVSGGGGGGSGTQEGQEGSGGGFGMSARPVGAYKIKGDEVTWIPAIDVTKVAIGGQVLALVALLVIRSILKKRRRS
jgi:uncharacterized spore protein YtfJ